MFNIKSISILILVVLGGVISSCHYLDIKPDNVLDDEDIWSDRKLTRGYLANIYTDIPDYRYNKGFGFQGMTDELDHMWDVLPVIHINAGDWSPTTNFQNWWGHNYEAIRKTFIFQNNIGRSNKFSDDKIEQLKGEAKFLRGYFYWLLLRQYGPVPLIKEEKALSSNWELPRAPFDSVVNYIVKMMDEAATVLPTRWEGVDSKWIGKPDKVICQCIKGTVLTMAASPQWNGNPAYKDFKNKDGQKLVHTDYDSQRWERAMEANRDAVRLAETNGIKLYRNNENGDGDTFNPYKSIRNVYFSWNPEIVWGQTRKEDDASHAFFDNIGVYCSPGPNNNGGVGPTMRMIDAFFMKNGKWIYDSNSGYVENGFVTEQEVSNHYKPDGTDPETDRVEIIESIRKGDSWGAWPGDWKMYLNREPRFYADILYNHRIIPQLPITEADRDFYSQPNHQDGYGRYEAYLGGTSNPGGTSHSYFSRTGTLQLKLIDPKDNLRQKYYSDKNRPRVLLRYAKVLLDYIETLNEVNPNSPDIAKYWNDIRSRAGIPNIFDVYPNIKGDKDLQRKHIIRERHVELCFEPYSFDRYFTMRRRLLAGSPPSGDPKKQLYGIEGDFYGLNVTGGDKQTNDFDTETFYERKVYETRPWDDKMYLFPIPQSEIEKDPKLVQNPGW